MPPNPLLTLGDLGQSVWLDYISRNLLTSGQLQSLITEIGLKGMTSNPTIFEKAIDGTDNYTDELKKLVAQKKSPLEIYDQISIEDIGSAADLLKPVYEKTSGLDGFVSLEVLPDLAKDTGGSIKEAHRLFDRLNRPNIMIKIPGTPEGIPAIRQCIADGININITLLFDIGNYEQVMDAYLSGLKTRTKNNQAIDKIASVASFFVSRVDTTVDKALQEKIDKNPSDKEELRTLFGKAAVANAKLAYQKFKETFSSSRFQNLKSKGARLQRPLWASTSTKNPNYSDILYVQDLIAKDSVNTMPMETITAYKDHGSPRITIEDDLSGAHQTMQALTKAGIDLGAITKQLQAEGVKLFTESFNKLIQSIKTKQESLSGSVR